MSDGGGLFLLVKPNGSKLWRFKFHYNKKEKQISFGKYPEISLSKAREARAVAKQELLSGINPSKSRKAANHVTGKMLPPFGVGGFAADPVVHREAGVTPLKHAFGCSGARAAKRHATERRYPRRRHDVRRPGTGHYNGS